MVESHRVLKKSFETRMSVDDKELPLNHMMQETIANVLAGFARTLKGVDDVPEKIEIHVKRLHQTVGVDAHTYP